MTTLEKIYNIAETTVINIVGVSCNNWRKCKCEDCVLLRKMITQSLLREDKRESPRLQSWDESASMFFLILDISDYGISRNTSDRLAEIRTRPQRRQTGAQLCKFLTQNSR